MIFTIINLSLSNFTGSHTKLFPCEEIFRGLHMNFKIVHRLKSVLCWRVRRDVVQGPLDSNWDWWWSWQMITLRLETVLIGRVDYADDLTIGSGVLVLTLGDLSFQVGLASVLQVALFFSGDSIAGFVGVVVAAVRVDFLNLTEDWNGLVSGQFVSSDDGHEGKSDDLLV